MKLFILGLVLTMGGVGGVEQSMNIVEASLAGVIAGIGLILAYFGVQQIKE